MATSVTQLALAVAILTCAVLLYSAGRIDRHAVVANVVILAMALALTTPDAFSFVVAVTAMLAGYCIYRKCSSRSLKRRL